MVSYLLADRWKAFVYYLYTGKVEFARLKSQKPVVQPLAKTAQMSASAPPCSPKSMYKLADEVSVRGLSMSNRTHSSLAFSLAFRS